MIKRGLLFLALGLAGFVMHAKEYHVAKGGTRLIGADREQGLKVK